MLYAIQSCILVVFWGSVISTALRTLPKSIIKNCSLSLMAYTLGYILINVEYSSRYQARFIDSNSHKLTVYVIE